MNSEKYAAVNQAARVYQGQYHLRASVIIPHFNTHKLLSCCIAGLSLQTYPRNLFEVIVSDDGSDYVPNKSDLVYSELVDLKIISQPRLGRRVSAARNRAIEIATGEVIISIDADIVPVEQFIESHMRYFHVAEQVVTIGPRKFIDTSSVDPLEIPNKIQKMRYFPDVCSVSNHEYPFDGRIPFLERFQHEPKPYWFFYSCNIGFMRADVLRVGLFDQCFDGYWGYGDIDMGYRLFLNNNIFMYVPEALALHQENHTVSANQRRHDGEKNMAKLIAKWPELKDEEPNTLPEL